MTAQERRAQYNTITEKYVNTAVREQDYQQPPSTEVKPLEVVRGAGSEANLVSHTEVMREHYSSGGQTTARAADNTGQAHRQSGALSLVQICQDTVLSLVEP